VWNVFLEFNAPDYTEEGIQEFKSFITYRSLIKKFKKKELVFWGCMEKNELTGVIALGEHNHIYLLFVKKEFHRRGISKQLLEAVKESCKNQNLNHRITVNSSPYAIEVYHRLGFVEINREHTVKGITFTPMAYPLDQSE
jgi:GNAT superfamily N-acetyltransferase